MEVTCFSFSKLGMKYYVFVLIITIGICDRALACNSKSSPKDNEEVSIITDEVPESSAPVLTAEEMESLLRAAHLPSSPANVSATAKECSSCGEGPLMGCPREGDCPTGMGCCFDKCRRIQVCREFEFIQKGS